MVRAGVLYDAAVPLLMSMANMNAVMNFFIYSARHRDIRLGVKYLFTGKVTLYSISLLQYSSINQSFAGDHAQCTANDTRTGETHDAREANAAQ